MSISLIIFYAIRNPHRNGESCVMEFQIEIAICKKNDGNIAVSKQNTAIAMWAIIIVKGIFRCLCSIDEKLLLFTVLKIERK